MTVGSNGSLLDALLADNAVYAKTFDAPMSLGVKKKVGGHPWTVQALHTGTPVV